MGIGENELVGRRFGEWTVLSFAGMDKRRASLWLCRCSCGLEKNIQGYSLRNKKSTGCVACGRKKCGKKHTGPLNKKWRGGKNNKCSYAYAAQKLATMVSAASRHGHAPPNITVRALRRLCNQHCGFCDICGNRNRKRNGVQKSLNLDHCHVTGRVRGCLCDGCNLGLGSFSDCAESLKIAAIYLQTCQLA